MGALLSNPLRDGLDDAIIWRHCGINRGDEMKLLFLMTVVLGMAASPCLAAPAACSTAGDPQAAVVPIVKLSNYMALGMVGAALYTSDVADAAKSAAKCTRGDFEVKGVTYTLTGETSDTLARRAVPQRGRLPSIYLMSIPDVGAINAAKPGEHAPPAFALVISDGANGDVVKFFTKVPPDDVLKREMAAALTSGSYIIRMNLSAKKIEINAAGFPDDLPD